MSGKYTMGPCSPALRKKFVKSVIEEERNYVNEQLMFNVQCCSDLFVLQKHVQFNQTVF